MANASKLPLLTELITTQLSRSDYKTPALLNALNATDTTSTVKLTGAIKDGAGNIITGAIPLSIKDEDGYTEHMWAPAGSSTDGITFANVVRGIKLNGIDYTVGSSSNKVSHKGGEQVFVGVSAVLENLVRSALQGTIATGGSNFIIGVDAAGTVTISRSTGTGTYVGWARHNGTKGQYSNDGTTWVNFDDVTASDLLKVSSADTTAGYLNDKIDVATSGRLVKSITNPAGNEQVALTLATTLTDAEMNQMHGISADVTDTNLSTLTAGPTSDADALHTHAGLGVESFTFAEAIDGSTTPKAVFISKGTTISDAWIMQSQLTENDTDQDVYGVNFYTQTFTTSKYQNRISQIDLLLMGVGAVGANNFQMDIYAVDGAHKPTGASLATKTVLANAIPNTYIYWQSFVLASELTVTPATEYAIVCKFISGSAAAYVEWQTGTGDTYTSGQPFQSTDAGATWSTLVSDFAFRVWGRDAQTAGQVYLSEYGESFRGGFDGFATTNTGAGATGSVRLTGKQTSFTGLTAGADYYVDTTEGAVATSGGLKVGRATSTTTIEIEKEFGFIAPTKINSYTAIGALNRGLLTEDEYYVNFDCGFKPSKVELGLSMAVQTGAATNVRVLMFNGSYITSLYGTALKYGTTGAPITEFVDTTTGTSLAVVDGAAATTLTANGFMFTQTGFRFKLSTTETVSASNLAYISAILYR